MEPEEDYEYSCPYCGETLSLKVDLSGGRRQAFVTDCEVCCKPIQIRLTLGDGEIADFSADAEN